ncbi:rRNA maturation RNase YbeY [Candidatus Falkowbacteria bacterium]|nr:rRNA maturation RNase YbeY [Candidatus Falkowbacteria bacterium]
MKKVVAVFNRESGLKGKIYFSLAFVDAITIKKLNRNYRGRNKITDILSFAEDNRDFIEMPSAEKYLGEILICAPQAEKQAKQFNQSLKKEIARLLIHGLAHLVGYEHEGVSPKRAGEMRGFENKIIARIFKV